MIDALAEVAIRYIKQGFKVFTHQGLSCNDSSLSLGQAVIANFST